MAQTRHKAEVGKSLKSCTCPYHEKLGCVNQDRCASCGWNPDSGVHKRRIAAALKERNEKLRAGQVHAL